MPDTPTPAELARWLMHQVENWEAGEGLEREAKMARLCAAALSRLSQAEQDLKSLFDEGSRVKAELIDARAALAQAEQERYASDAALAEADAVINYDTARHWPRYGMESPILQAGEDVPARSAAMKRHAERHKRSRQQRGTA